MTRISSLGHQNYHQWYSSQVVRRLIQKQELLRNHLRTISLFLSIFVQMFATELDKWSVFGSVTMLQKLGNKLGKWSNGKHC